MMGKIERMKKLIEEIEKCDFECKTAGHLLVCFEWIELKKEIYELEAAEKLEPRCVDTRPKKSYRKNGRGSR